MDQNDTLDLIATEALIGSGDAHNDFGSGHRFNVSVQDRTVPEFDSIVASCPQFVTYAATRNIIRSGLQRKSAGFEAFLAEGQNVLPRRDLNNLGRRSRRSAVDFNVRALGY